MVLAMSEEQLKAAVEPTEQVEEGVEEISEEDLAGVDGGGLAGGVFSPKVPPLPQVMAPLVPPSFSNTGTYYID